MRYMKAMAVALGLAAAPVFAAESTEPVKLSDSELDRVTAGALINVSANVIIPINAALVVQANVLGVAAQDATATATQTNNIRIRTRQR